MERSIAINGEKCIHCGLCLRDCVASCLEFDENKIPRYVTGGENMCLSCQHCLAICPTGAFSFGGLDPAASDPVTTVDSTAMLGLIKSRRSIRQYKQADVPREKLEKIKEMLAYPPTGVNAPSLHFSIIATNTKMDELRKITYDCIDSLPDDSPLAIFKEMAHKSRKAGKDLIYRGAPALIVASVDETKVAKTCKDADPNIALSYLELYAASLGLGTVWDGMAVVLANHFPQIKAQFKLPAHCELSFIMALGIPAVTYARTPQLKAENITMIE